MATNPWVAFKAAAKRLETRGDTFARKCLSADEYEEAVALDLVIKRDFWKWLAYYVLASAFGALIVIGLRPELNAAKALFASAMVLLYGLVAVASAWYGYRKWANRPAWKVVAIFIGLMVGGFAVGLIVSTFATGKPLADMNWEKFAKGLSVALLMGIGLAIVLVTIAHLRQREAAQKAARLQAEAEREKFARHSVQAELKLLQAQVEPHFLFNTLANIRHLVHTGSPDALAMMDHLIQYLRTALPEIRAEGSTLGREAELVRAYLEILRIRMGGALSFTIDIPAELARQPFPPMMLITLVENAVKHGVAPLGRGHVEVRAMQEGSRIRVAVEDDGQGLQEPIGQGIGLTNIRDRLRVLFGEAARLELGGRDGAGTRAMIEVPT
ncbi:hypothetical protein BWI17_06600 [Betaproteobacteria bacterium GR16-43]|nr:hypothetical protein BWI17_06600 [Betaproteobacteria bacterium GR16-43]